MTTQTLSPAGTLEPYRGEKGEAWIQWENRRKTQYRAWLKQEGYTRDSYTHNDGLQAEITIKAVAVWDTVGCLGIPAVPVIGLKGSSQQWKFTNTQISRKVEDAFQALALDEPRYDFLPSLWEKLPDNTTTHLKQVWFPGHSNIGGGWEDQQIADMTLAWMCDQLKGPRVGVAFDEDRITSLFKDGLRYSCGGLALDDKHTWTCTGLTSETAPDEDDDEEHMMSLWRLEKIDGVAPVPEEASSKDLLPLYPLSKVAGTGRWHWVLARNDSRYKIQRPPA